VRTARARQLLAETGHTISQIAETLGFCDVFFSSRQFTQRTGQTPSAYRAALAAAGGWGDAAASGFSSSKESRSRPSRSCILKLKLPWWTLRMQ
jgi:AraC-like DNA-binding protein